MNHPTHASLSRRHFLSALGATALLTCAPTRLWSSSAATHLRLAQLIYSDGNWQPRPTALRRLAWELHKRTAVPVELEPVSTTPTTAGLGRNPLLFMLGDRPFAPFPKAHLDRLRRYLRLGGTLIIDPAHTVDGDPTGFRAHAHNLAAELLPDAASTPIQAEHVIFRSFYRLTRPTGRIRGPETLTGWPLGDRMAIISTDHDLAGALARDNLGNWEFPVEPGGDRQRENAFRLGINLVMYALCLDYKNEQPHLRFPQSPAP
ncbi:MAG: DUF4159 domain-containing protein [Proteobacteria bacterium]|nr:DUF4159 domain-containing protein [Pseudomonadota bacterium]